MAASHEIMLVAGLLCLLAIFAGLLSARIGAPLLVVFIGVGMLAGEDGFGGIPFDNFQSAYLIGNLALAAILFQGGHSTKRGMIRQAFWPSLALATVGVGMSAGLVGLGAHVLFHLPWLQALLLGAVTAPTDAAAVSTLLRLSRAEVPSRVVSALEVESGLNDPMSVVLTIVLVQWLTHPAAASLSHAVILFFQAMIGGAAIGLGCGYGLLFLFKKLKAPASIIPVLAVGATLAIFGGAQMLEASGFLAVYLAGLVLGNHEHPGREPISRFFGALGWLAQISLFLMLGLLVSPHELPPYLIQALTLTGVLVFIARPVAVLLCLTPMRWRLRESLFISWVGLRGAVPIYLTIIPLLSGVSTGQDLFDTVFVVVIVSVIVQGWTISPAAKLLRLRSDPTP